MQGVNPVIIQNSGYYPNDTNLINKFKQTHFDGNSGADMIVLNNDMVADLEYQKDKKANGDVFEGKVNGKDAMFKCAYKSFSGNNRNIFWYEGALDGKYFLLNSDNGSFSGKYGDNEFDLQVTYDQPSKFAKNFNWYLRGKYYTPDFFNIKGQIAGKEVDLTLPNCKIPQDDATRDIVTMLLEVNGLKAQVINGEVKTLRNSEKELNAVRRNGKKRDELIKSDIKPIIMQTISSATAMVGGAIISALLIKAGLKR